MALRIAAVVLLAGLAGCLNSEAQLDPAGAPPLANRPPVVALIDTGLNPYHEALIGTASIHSPSIAEIALTPSGTYSERLANDAGVLNAREYGQMVHFVGTRAYAISFTNETPTRFVDDSGHGARTAGIVAQAAPEAVIVMVETRPEPCAIRGDTSCYYDPSVPAAMRWASEQSWIDVISVSIGEPADKPHNAATEPELAEYIAAARAAVDAGKLVVNSAGNTPHPTIMGSFDGPPWVIAVGGAEGANRGESVEASKFVDVVANFTVASPDPYDTSAITVSSGTSYAAPTVAATLARAIGILRTQHGVDSYGLDTPVTPADLRNALNQSAVRWSPSDWDPLAKPSNDTLRSLLYPTAPVLLGPAQMGWGYVDPSLADEIARVAVGGNPEDPPAILYTNWMAAYDAARKFAWE